MRLAGPISRIPRYPGVSFNKHSRGVGGSTNQVSAADKRPVLSGAKASPERTT